MSVCHCTSQRNTMRPLNRFSSCSFHFPSRLQNIMPLGLSSSLISVSHTDLLSIDLTQNPYLAFSIKQCELHLARYTFFCIIFPLGGIQSTSSSLSFFGYPLSVTHSQTFQELSYWKEKRACKLYLWGILR